MTIITTYLDDLKALHSFARATEDIFERTARSDFDVLKAPLKELAQSEDINLVLQRALTNILRDPSYCPSEFDERQFVLLDSEIMSLSLCLFYAEQGNTSNLAEYPADVLLHPLGQGDVDILLHGIPPERKTDLFNSSQSLVRGDALTLSTGEAVLIRTGVHVGELRFKTDFVALKVVSKTISAFTWTYDRQTLIPLYTSSSTLQASRIKTAVQTLGKLTSALGIDQITLDNVENLTAHHLHFVRWAAIQTLFSLDEEKGTKALIQAMKDEHPHISNAARKSYAKLVALKPLL